MVFPVVNQPAVMGYSGTDVNLRVLARGVLDGVVNNILENQLDSKAFLNDFNVAGVD